MTRTTPPAPPAGTTPSLHTHTCIHTHAHTPHPVSIVSEGGRVAGRSADFSIASKGGDGRILCPRHHQQRQHHQHRHQHASAHAPTVSRADVTMKTLDTFPDARSAARESYMVRRCGRAQPVAVSSCANTSTGGGTCSTWVYTVYSRDRSPAGAQAGTQQTQPATNTHATVRDAASTTRCLTTF